MTAVMEECAEQSAFLSQERTGIKSDKGGKYMKKTGTNRFTKRAFFKKMTAAALCAVCLTAAVPAVCQAGGARQDVSAAYRKESALPAFKYTGNKKELAVICEYLLEKKAPLYKDADVFIPAPVIFGIREKGGETLVFGNFWIFGYDLSGATLICESGGAMPACFHLAKDGDSYKVTKVEQAEDGAGFTDSIEKMTKGYKKIRKKMLVSNEKKEKQVRRNWIRNYVQANNLAVTAYKDYGWDPVSVR